MPTKKALKKLGKARKKPLIKKTLALSSKKAGPRLKKLNKKQHKLVYKKEQQQKKLPPAWTILFLSLKHLYRHKWTFLGILLIYAIFYILFIKGISANFQLGNLRKNLTTTFNGKLNSFNTGVALFGLLLGTAGSGNSESAGIYQTVLVIIVSLAFIWALRASFGNSNKVSIKDSFYKSTGSLIPFIVICVLLVVQLLPALIVGSLYSSVQSSGILVGWFQKGVAIAILVSGVVWTLRMISSTLFALYIVTLADAKPWASIKAARQLVIFRRTIVIRRILFLPVVLLLFSAIVLLPLIIFIPTAAEVLFLIFTILLLGVMHSYFYTLYRRLIND